MRPGRCSVGNQRRRGPVPTNDISWMTQLDTRCFLQFKLQHVTRVRSPVAGRPHQVPNRDCSTQQGADAQLSSPSSRAPRPLFSCEIAPTTQVREGSNLQGPVPQHTRSMDPKARCSWSCVPACYPPHFTPMCRPRHPKTPETRYQPRKGCAAAPPVCCTPCSIQRTGRPQPSRSAAARRNASIHSRRRHCAQCAQRAGCVCTSSARASARLSARSLGG